MPTSLTGYDLLNGAFGGPAGAIDLYLTIDAGPELRPPTEALDGRKGTVAVYNYQTGEILCLVSSPTYDPRNVPDGLGDRSQL